MTTDLRSPIWRILFLICVELFLSAASYSGGEDEERGLGGTGLRTAAILDVLFSDDRGMGGTGIVGTITAFGSIWVNGVEIEYDSSTDMRIDGEKANMEQLRLGQQVQVVVERKAGGVYADSIAIEHELVGPVESIDSENRTMQVLGQQVVFETAAPGHWSSSLQVGDVVSVSGYRGDGDTIQATDVAVNSNASRWLLKGFAERREDGLYLGDYPLADTIKGVSDGDRVFLSGDRVAGRLRVMQGGVISQQPFDGAVETILIEGERNRDGSISYAGGHIIRANKMVIEPEAGHRERDYLLIHQRKNQEKPAGIERSSLPRFDSRMHDRGEQPDVFTRPEIPDSHPPDRDVRPEIVRPPIEDFHMMH